MSGLAFTVLAVMLVGPVPALLSRAKWPLRAPRAAMVLWQAVALAAVLSAFSAGIAIASRLLVPGPDGRPTASVVGAADRLGWPLWTAYITVFALTVLGGIRLMGAVLWVAVGGTSTVLRVRRLSGRGNSPMLSAAAYLTAAAVLVVPTIALVVPWFTE